MNIFLVGMAAAAGAALFRSTASKTAPALPPHRVIAARGLHSSGVGRSSPNPSRLSTSSGSSATSNEHLAARDHQVHRQVGDHLADSEFMKGIKDQIKSTTNTCLTVLVFGTGLFYTFVKPKLNKLEDKADALSREVFKLRQEIKLKNIKDEGHKTKIYGAQSMENLRTKSTA